ncbi:MAG: hypothetical protein FGM18_02385 [Burkholderiaceae bacterium]|nr:hypothetical protein [Burkholderiaceae bacterium]
MPAHAEGLREELVGVSLENGAKQVGLLSIKIGSSGHSRLAVLLPGYPSVFRPTVENGVMTKSRLSGNFLIRARRHLADDTIALLTVDCHSESGDYCSSSYQASAERQAHVQKLINEVRSRHPSIQGVWLIGTSMGTISSSFMPTYAPQAYLGAIHTASITNPYAPNSYRELRDFDYRKSGIPQIFVHHKNDPCVLTTWSDAKKISGKFDLPLVTVTGGSGFSGDACNAFTEHGFRGKEQEVMAAIGKIVKTGKVEAFEI